MANEAKLPRVIFDEERGLEVLSTLCQMWRDKAWIFRDVVLPEDQFPQIADPIKNAHWKFLAALPQRGGVVAEDPFAPLWWLYKNNPELFDPITVAKSLSVQKIRQRMSSIDTRILKNAPVGEGDAGALGLKLSEYANSWYENSVTIAKQFNGDIFNLFRIVEDVPPEERFEAAYKIIRSPRKHNKFFIVGMRRKIFSLFIIWLQKDGLLPFFPCPVPVDFHALRILKGTGVIKFRGTKPIPKGTKHLEALEGLDYIRLTDNIIDEVAKWTNEFLQKHGLNHLDANPALWVLSRELCADHPQNTSRNSGKFYLLPDILKQWHQFWPRTFRNLCQVCPLEGHCDTVTPARPYYKAGSLVYMERVPFPLQHEQEMLFGTREEMFVFRGSKRSRSKQQRTLDEWEEEYRQKYSRRILPINHVQEHFWNENGNGFSHRKREHHDLVEKKKQARITK